MLHAKSASGAFNMSTISPNMSLIIPTAGQTIGPTYALDVNSSLSLVDMHDHTPGHGVQITPEGINVNSTLVFNNNFADQLAGLTLIDQGTTPPISTVYAINGDLYFLDGFGNNVRITQSGGVAGSPGSIGGLVAPASATYVPGQSSFVWQSNTNIAANMDFGSAIMRNLSPNSTYALTLTPPANLVNNYTLTLPSLPAVQSFMTLDNSGIITAPWTVDNNTIKITGNQLVAQSNVVSPQREHSWELNGAYPGLSFPQLNIDSIFFAPANMTITSVWIYNGQVGGTGITEFDLKVANSGGSFTSILTTTGKVASTANSDVWTDSGSIIAPQTGVTKPVIATAAISAGQAIRFDLLSAMTSPATDARIRIFYSLA